MKLWIRSQDKKAIVEIESIFVENKYTHKKVRKLYMPDYATSYDDIEETYDYEDDEYIKTIIYNNAFLGEYSSEKRALEVLDEIQHKINAIANMTDENFINVVYQMPKE